MSLDLQSSDIKDLLPDLIKARAAIRHAIDDSNNPHTKSDYASIEAVLDAIIPHFLGNKILPVQQPTLIDGKDYLVTTLYHTSGQWVRSYTRIISDSNKNPAQAFGSGLSYAKRYALQAMAAIGSRKDDDDGHLAGSDDEQGKQPESVSAKVSTIPSCKKCGGVMRKSKFNDGYYCPKQTCKVR